MEKAHKLFAELGYEWHSTNGDDVYSHQAESTDITQKLIFSEEHETVFIALSPKTKARKYTPTLDAKTAKAIYTKVKELGWET